MHSKANKDLDGELADSLQGELEREFVERAANPSKGSQAQENALEQVTRLPRRIAGGFAGVGHDLDRRSRDWRHTYRLMEQQRPHLEAAEAERDRLHDALDKAVTEVKEGSRIFREAIESTKEGDVSSDLVPQFNRCLTGLDELESVAEALTVNMLNIRTCWEQYARTILRAQKMRDDLRENAPKMPQAAQ
ncbi:MAG TPA: hypothetical protein VFJ18_03735 [Pararhizobium sp.]|nr:hypothetical protein [Pararhizobium sp.]